MFTIKLNNSDLFRDIIQNLSQIFSELNLNVDCDKLNLSSMDKSHVSVVELYLTPTFFDYYNCSQPCTIGISLISLAKVLKFCLSDDILTLSHRSDENHLGIKIERTSPAQVCQFNLYLMTIEEEGVTVPRHLTYRIRHESTAGNLNDCFKMFVPFSENVSFNWISGQGGLTIESKNKDCGFVTIVIPNIIDLKGPKPSTSSAAAATKEDSVRCSYTLKNLLQLTKIKYNDVSLNIADDLPLLICFDFSPGNSLKYYIAPNIDDDDN